VLSFELGVQELKTQHLKIITRIGMRVVIQRVSEASVTVDGVVVGQIGRGLLVLLGVGAGDDLAEAEPLAEKIANLRIFPDAEGRFNRSLLDIGGGALVVSQFTLYADTRRGRRPSFSDAASPDAAAPLVDAVVAALQRLSILVATGVFGAHMRVGLVNDGPVTILLDSETFRAPRRNRD
jgi:D-aminoacyl-tRNA deacylase